MRCEKERSTLLHEARDVVKETAERVGVAPPRILEDEAAVPEESTITASDENAFYLVGLIGGKNVGKSTLINALVGHNVTAESSFGPRTEKVVAYAHDSQAGTIR